MYNTPREDLRVHRTERRKASCLLPARPMVQMTVAVFLIKRTDRLYRVTQKDGLNFVRLYFLNYTWYVNDLHNI